MDSNKSSEQPKGPFWSQSYFIYIVLTVVLFCLMLLIGWVALRAGLIPKR